MKPTRVRVGVLALITFATLLSDQQSHPGHVVPADQTRSRQRRVFGRSILGLEFMIPVLTWIAAQYGCRVRQWVAYCSSVLVARVR